MKYMKNIKDVKIGDLISFYNYQKREFEHGIVLCYEGSGFYCVFCNKKAQILLNPDPNHSLDNYVFHSDLLTDSKVAIIKNIELKDKNGLLTIGIDQINNYILKKEKI